MKSKIISVSFEAFERDIASPFGAEVWQVSDWKEVSDEFLELLAETLQGHGKKLHVVDNPDDTVIWRIV